MKMNMDSSYFSIICSMGNCLYTPEMDLQDMNIRQIVRDIRDGQLENVQVILEFNPEEGWCNDVTTDVMTSAFRNSETAPDEEDWSDYNRERIDGSLAGVATMVAV